MVDFTDRSGSTIAFSDRAGAEIQDETLAEETYRSSVLEYRSGATYRGLRLSGNFTDFANTVINFIDRTN